jgi:hypothetical protein
MKTPSTLISIWFATWCSGPPSPGVQITLPGAQRRLELRTDINGDGLYHSAACPTGLGKRVFAARDFSLNRYDLSTETGRRSAREYVRRKLPKLVELV